jgi:hypothetical protein
VQVTDETPTPSQRPSFTGILPCESDFELTLNLLTRSTLSPAQLKPVPLVHAEVTIN